MISDIYTSNKAPAEAFEQSLHTMTGNVIPHNWYHSITTSSGRPDHTAILILAEIVYWYRPRKVQHTSYHEANKFQGDAWQTSYEHFSTKFGCSKETVRRTFVKLEAYGVISREFRTISKYGQIYNNRLFIHLHKDKLEMMLPNTNTMTSITYISNNKKICPSHHKIDTPSPQNGGELYKEEEINYKNNKTRSSESNFFEKNESSLHFNLSEFEKQSSGVGGWDSNNRHLPRKALSEFYPISEEDAFYLQKTSLRDFSRSYINKLLLKLMDTKPDHGFYTKDLFLSYMSKVLSNELRNPINTNNTDFNFALPKDVRAVEDYLNNIESSRLTDNTTQLKKKIIGSFEASDAHSLLANLTFDYVTNETNNESIKSDTNTIKIRQNNITSKCKSSFVLSKAKQDKIAKLIPEVFGQTTEVVFDLKYDEEQKSKPIDSLQKPVERGGISSNTEYATYLDSSDECNATTISKPTTFEQNVLNLLKRRYGSAVYNSWFSRLKVNVEDVTADKIIDNCSIAQDFTQTEKLNAKVSILAPTAFMRDYLKTNYGHKIESIVSELISTADTCKNYRLSREGVIWV